MCACVSCSELWCGQSKSKLTIFNLDRTSGSLHTLKVTGSGNEVTTSADVVHLAAGLSDSRAVMWAYVYPGMLLVSVCVTSLTITVVHLCRSLCRS